MAPLRTPPAVVLRPLGSSLGLGLGGLTIGSLVMGGSSLGWVPVAQSHQVGLLVLVATVPLQLIATVFALLARDGAVAGAMALLAASWAATGAAHLTSAPGATSDALGLVVLAGGALVVMSAIANAPSKPAPVAAALLLAGLHFLLLGVYQLSASATWQDISGVVSIVTAAVAGLAAIVAERQDVTAAREGVEHEAGVRPLL